MLLAEFVLAVHLTIIGFNLFGLVAIPVGAWRRWPLVRGRVWRVTHLVSFGVVALQAALGRACFLTDWQAALSGRAPTQPLIMRWVNSVIFWPLPGWVFEALYLALFAYVLALFWLIPPGARAVSRD
jgi:hypothetical protein